MVSACADAIWRRSGSGALTGATNRYLGRNIGCAASLAAKKARVFPSLTPVCSEDKSADIQLYFSWFFPRAAELEVRFLRSFILSIDYRETSLLIYRASMLPLIKPHIDVHIAWIGYL